LFIGGERQPCNDQRQEKRYWSSSGDEILFAAAANGNTTSLYAVSRSGRQHMIAHFPGSLDVLDRAPDGRLLMSHEVFSYSLFYQPNVDSKETDLYWHDFSTLSDISRDGRALLFSEAGDATRSDESFVSYLRGTDGSPAVRLGPGYPLGISPDGNWALVLASSLAPAQLVLLPTGTGEARPLTHDAIHHQGAAWAPDGKRIVFVGNEPSHRIRYFVQDLDGGRPRAITPENVGNYDNVAHQAVKHMFACLPGAELPPLTRRRLIRTDVQESQLGGAFSECRTIRPKPILGGEVASRGLVPSSRSGVQPTPLSVSERVSLG
jgi:hypothetical protein